MLLLTAEYTFSYSHPFKICPGCQNEPEFTYIHLVLVGLRIQHKLSGAVLGQPDVSPVLLAITCSILILKRKHKQVNETHNALTSIESHSFAAVTLYLTWQPQSQDEIIIEMP